MVKSIFEWLTVRESNVEDCDTDVMLSSILPPYPFVLSILSLGGVLGLLARFFFCRSEGGLRLSIGRTDGWGMVLMVYLFVRAIGDVGWVDRLLELLTLCGVYLVVRMLDRPKLFLGMLAVAGMVQSVVIVGQQMGWCGSGHSLFEVTGLLGNPGPAGALQAVALTSVVVLIVGIPRGKPMRYVWMGAGGMMGYGLLILDSRASILAVIVAVASLCVPSIGKKWRRLVWPVVGAVGCLILIGLYVYRPASADARLLVWSNTVRMIADRPLCGYGWHGFEREYMLHQADYFSKFPESEWRSVADNVAYPYQELLRAGVEWGMVGVLLLLLVLWSGLKQLSEQDRQGRTPLLTWLVFSCFSYPTDVPVLNLLFPMLIGLSASTDRIWSIEIRKRYVGIVGGVLLCGLFMFSIQQLLFYRQADRAIMQGRNQERRAFLLQNRDRLMCFPKVNCLVADQLSHYPEELTEEWVKRFYPSCENYCDMGNFYFRKGNCQKAEYYYREASYMIPTRLRPDYCLWELYRDCGRTEDARRMAELILEKPLKVENTFTLRTKGIVRRWLQEIEQ